VTRPDSPNAVGPRAAQRFHGRVLGLGLGLLALAAPFGTTAVRAQAQPAAAAPPSAAAAFDVAAVRQLLARGDAAAAAGNLTEARRFYDDARDASRRLAGFYRTIAGAFRGLDARIPREMDDKGRQAIELLSEANMRLAALFRRQGQPEVAVPLLVEVLTAATPTSEQGRKAYQQLVEIGFVATPYAAGAAAGN
jgi:hypothetical protein